MIEIKDFSKRFGDRIIYDHLNLTLPEKGVVAIVGESGSGKTTLLNAIAGLDFDYEGAILINYTNLKSLSPDELSDYRIHHIGYVFQNFNLLNLADAETNVILPFESTTNSKSKIRRRKITEIFSKFGISKLKKQNVNKLSGGEKQRVAIARAVINSPSVVLCDEPTGALDEKNSQQIYNILREISSNSLVIIASHDFAGVSKIADKIISIKDGIVVVEDVNNDYKIEHENLLQNNKVIKEPSLTSSFKIKHSIAKMKTKKYRSLITNGMLSLSLTGIGLSIIITSSVSNKINEAFSNIINGNQIVMSLKQENQNTFSNAYSAPYKNVNDIYEKYNYYLEGVGATYIVNFENFFKDRNEVFFVSPFHNVYIPALSTRSINDFKWIGSERRIMYPLAVKQINNDQIVLGLSYQDMVNLCFELKIQRNFSSLGRYIHENKAYVTLTVENKDWQYDDEQIFEVVAVTESQKTIFYHSNTLWNQEVFEKMMRLPSNDTSLTTIPWQMHKLFYLKTLEQPSVFLDAIFYDNDFCDYVFERTNYDYNPLLCNPNETCDEKRVFVYAADKSAINPAHLKYLTELDKRIQNYYFITDFGYASYASNLLSGFSKNVFVSLNQEKALAAADADTQISENNIQINLPDDVVEGNFLNGISGGLRFSTDFSKLIEGRIPRNNNEITISKGLAEKIDKEGAGIGKYLYFAGENSEYLAENNHLIKDYRICKMVVVGIVDEEQYYLYHNPDWSISFFRDQLGVSSFMLVPKSVVIELDKDVNASELIERFTKIYREYSFTSPINELSKSVESTLSYANTILIGFSVLSAIISILLLGTVVLLNVLENKDEIRLLQVIGIRDRDIHSLFIYQSVIQGLIAFAFSSIELIVVDFVISKALGASLGTSLGYTFNFLPIGIVFLFAVILPFLTSLIMVRVLFKKKRVYIDKQSIN